MHDCMKTPDGAGPDGAGLDGAVPDADPRITLPDALR